MPTTITNTIQHLAWDGPVRLSVAIAIGLALLLLFAWALWRERQILGTRTTVLFWLLRSLAAATVMWMLLAPTQVRVETATTRRAVALAADTSGSMRVVDPPGTADDLRWALGSTNTKASSNSESDHGRGTRAADRAVVAIGVAQRELRRAGEALDQYQPESTVLEAVAAAQHALRRTALHLQTVYDVARGGQPTPETAELAEHFGKNLETPEFQAFERLSAALARGRTPAEKGWRESLPDLEQRVAAMRRPLRQLAQRVAAEEADEIAQTLPSKTESLKKAPRLERAVDFLRQLQRSTLAGMQDTADVHWHRFDESAARLADQRSPERSLAALLQSPEPEENVGTDIAVALEQAHRVPRDQPLAAVILLSDMAHNRTRERNPREVAATFKDTPVHVVPIGNTRHVRDVVLQSVYAPTVVMRNDEMVVEVNVQAYDCARESGVIQLLHEGEVVDFREVEFDSEVVSRSVRFDRRMPAVGVERYQVAVVPLAGELAEANNYDAFEVNVTRSDIKVLLADELPRWEYRYLAQLFRRDTKVACDELLFHPRLVATGHREKSGTVPISVDDWDQYDVVVLGDVSPEHLPIPAQEALVEYLERRGGTLVMIAGAEAMPQAYVGHPLERVLPVSPVSTPPSANEAFALRLTAEGARHDALKIGESDEATRTAWDLVNRQSPLHRLSAWRVPRPTAHTLILAAPRASIDDPANPGDAFLCWQPVGRGRIVYLAGPETYRLRLLRGDSLHYRFWGQLLRWAIATDLAAGTDLVRISTPKARYDENDVVETVVQLKDHNGHAVTASDLEVRATSGDAIHTTALGATEVPGQYRAEFHALPAGVYRIEPVGSAIDELQAGDQLELAVSSFAVVPRQSSERTDTRSDRVLAQQIADITGGQVVPPTAVAELLELTNVEPIVSERTERQPLWLQWKYLWLVFGCLQVEWVIRKWRGLS